MIIKKFQGKTKEEALECAKKELGEGIVEMNVKTVKAKGLLGVFKGTKIEVTVAKEEENEKYGIASAKAHSEKEVKDGVALYVTGMGKVNSALSLQAVLNDDRFDFSNAYIISTGCAGSAIEYGDGTDCCRCTVLFPTDYEESAGRNKRKS